MIEQRIKAATCRITCGNESGTGWLITNGCVITARHCVLAAITEAKPIELFFPDSDDVAVPTSLIAESEENDACLLSLDAETSAAPIPVTFKQPRDGEAWQAFGYPQTKPALGHRLSGVVAQVLVAPKLKVDLDLSVDPIVALQAYRGFSGAAVVCEGVAVGIIRLKIDGTVAALSFHQFGSFLADHDIAAVSEGGTSQPQLLVDRKAFSKAFAEAIQARTGNYLFLEGAHGYGKSTFCSNFEPNDEKLINLGAYCLSSPDSALGPDYRAQPQIFLDWLATTISVLITGRPPRKSENSYAEQIRQTAEYLEAFSQFCAKTERRGVFFVDGLNEIPAGPLLAQLIGLLPIKLPPQITGVLTAPNFSNIAAHLSGRVKNDDVFALPPLADSACYSYCHRALKPERASPALVNRICQRAQGHPLYLRYLIEYANRQSADDALDDFPILEGSIEDYYNSIWTRLLTDEGAVNVLALMARLRWGVPLSDFAKILNQIEQASFVSVITRIRHLLADEEYTALYHSSFATFIIEHTSEIDEMAYRRIAAFCQKEKQLRYCVLNRIFHLLRAADSSVFAGCDQEWFDEAVTLGVEPDALIADVNAVVIRAAKEASADEFFRLTLLSQRVSFRYDTLFAQSARPIAEALITLGRPREALQHVLRLKTLIVGPDDALQIAFLLHHHGYDDEALMLLDRIQQRIVESYGDMDIRHFLGLCSWHIQTIFLIRLASDGSGMHHVMKVWEMARRSCEEVFKDDISEADRYMRSVDAESATYFLSFRDEYAEIARIKSQVTAIPPRYLQILCTALLKFERTVDDYHFPKGRRALDKLWPDLAELISTAELEPAFAPAVTDTLVRFGAPADLVEAFGAKGGKQPARPLQLVAKNKVDVNHEDLQECLCLWRVAAFLDFKFECPKPGIFLNTGWFDAMVALIGTLYWCDGKSRRAKADGDETARLACWDQLKARVVDQLRFTLHQRVNWRDAYAIPEVALPGVYHQLAELIIDCFPEASSEWLDGLIASADGQWGIYSEGFRNSALQVLTQFTRDKPTDDIAAKLLQLLRSLRDHVIRGVENRHELVPEILRIIPLFTRLGADEEAEGLYKYLLSVSMGPTWYKEDQLGLMTGVLGNISVGEKVQQRLPEVAGYLEHADGEMTFQRYVRAEKANLLGQIARQGEFRAAVAYFRRECCGSMPELWAEADQGPIDRVGPLQGNRFPGGALDDQAAILALVQNAGGVPWILRWALLEIFHCGDDRHLSDYGEAFAKIANEVGALPELIQRATLIADAEIPIDQRSSFAQGFRAILKPDLHVAFTAVLAGLPPPKPSEPVVRRRTDDDDDQGFFLPGVFGRQKALAEEDKLVEEAKRQQSLGNLQEAKEHAVKALQAAQSGGWSIWGGLSAGSRTAESLLIEGETSAADVIRHYAPLLEGELYAPKWMQAQHLIGRVAKLLTETERLGILDAVIDHVRLMVGNATREIQDFKFLADDAPQQNPATEFFRLIIWLCNHPQFLRRDRAAAALLWVVEQFPEMSSAASTTAFSTEEGYGSDVLCGVFDGASVREPVEVWEKIAASIDLAKITQELRHVSRMVVLLRIATRAAHAGSQSAISGLRQIQASFTGSHKTDGKPDLPSWATCLAGEWYELLEIVDTAGVAAWTKELELLCEPLAIPDAQALEKSVSHSFRENTERALNRWESKVRHALNLALWPRVSVKEAEIIEAVLRPYNPGQPERTIQGINNPITDQLMAAIDSGDYSAVLGSSSTVLINYHDMVGSSEEEAVKHVEVLCLLQPASKTRGFFTPRLEQFFRSSELPVALATDTPLETCCRLMPQIVFFGAFTSAIPLPSFRKVVDAEDERFVRQSWRHRRRNGVRRFGQPLREGCVLSIAREALKVPAGFKLAWIVWLNGEVVAFVDEHNNRLT